MITSATGQSIHFVSPEPLEVLDSVVNIRCYLSFPVPGISLTATVEGRSTDLVVDPSQGYNVGQLSLVGLKQGTLTLTVTATDGTTSLIASRSFIHDTKPILLVESPEAYSVARPYVYIKAKCIEPDGAPCRITLYHDASVYDYWMHFGSTIDSMVDMTTLRLGSEIQLVAKDDLGQTSSVFRMIYVQSDPFFKRIFDFHEPIETIHGDTVITLAVKNLREKKGITIWDMNTLEKETVPFSGLVSSITFLKDGICFFDETEWSHHKLKIWRNHTLESIEIGSGRSLRSNGNYISWTSCGYPCSGLSLTVYDYINKTSFTIPNTWANHYLTSQGQVVYREQGLSNLWLFSDGEKTSLTNDGYVVDDLEPSALFYYKTGSVALATHNFTEEKILHDSHVKDFKTSGRFLYLVAGDADSYSLWGMDLVSGEKKQIAAGPRYFFIERVNSSGYIIFRYNDIKGMQVASLDSDPVEIDPGIYKTVISAQFPDWRFPLGDELFGLDTSFNYTEPTIQPIYQYTNFATALPITLPPFDAAYHGSVVMAGVRFEKMPSNGVLVRLVRSSVGEQIRFAFDYPRAGFYRPNMEGLAYIPNPGFTGTDKFTWSAYDAFGKSDTSSYNISIYLPPSIQTIYTETRANTPFSLSLADFENSFSGTGPMLRIQIDSLPANGVLASNDIPIEKGSVIESSSIPSLQYSPVTDYSGYDQFFWRAYNFKERSGQSSYDITVTEGPIETPVGKFEKTISHIYPNPAQGIVNIRVNGQVEALRFVNVQGYVTASIPWSQTRDRVTADIQSLNEGLYLIRIKTEKGTFTARISVLR
jgi:hypothetical protein